MRDHDIETATEIIHEIRSKFGPALLARDFMPYERRYLNLVGPNPGRTVMEKWAWAIGKTNVLRAMLKKEGIAVLVNPIVPLHDYELHEQGFRRIPELEGLIQQRKQRQQASAL